MVCMYTQRVCGERRTSSLKCLVKISAKADSRKSSESNKRRMGGTTTRRITSRSGSRQRSNRMPAASSEPSWARRTKSTRSSWFVEVLLGTVHLLLKSTMPVAILWPLWAPVKKNQRNIIFFGNQPGNLVYEGRGIRVRGNQSSVEA